MVRCEIAEEARVRFGGGSVLGAWISRGGKTLFRRPTFRVTI
jgi:hypothetical protein